MGNGSTLVMLWHQTLTPSAACSGDANLEDGEVRVLTFLCSSHHWSLMTWSAFYQRSLLQSMAEQAAGRAVQTGLKSLYLQGTPPASFSRMQSIACCCHPVHLKYLRSHCARPKKGHNRHGVQRIIFPSSVNSTCLLDLLLFVIKMTEKADPTLTSEGNLDSFPAEAQLEGSTCLCLRRVSKVGRPVAKRSILLVSLYWYSPLGLSLHLIVLSNDCQGFSVLLVVR